MQNVQCWILVSLGRRVFTYRLWTSRWFRLGAPTHGKWFFYISEHQKMIRQSQKCSVVVVSQASSHQTLMVHLIRRFVRSSIPMISFSNRQFTSTFSMRVFFLEYLHCWASQGLVERKKERRKTEMTFEAKRFSGFRWGQNKIKKWFEARPIRFLSTHQICNTWYGLFHIGLLLKTTAIINRIWEWT